MSMTIESCFIFMVPQLCRKVIRVGRDISFRIIPNMHVIINRLNIRDVTDV